MKKKILLLAFIALFLTPSLGFGAGSVTQSLAYNGGGGYVWTISWTADASDGTVPDTAMATSYLPDVQGLYITLVITNPGSPAPTDNYDIVINDSDGVDVMGGTLANRDTSNSEQALPYIGSLAYGPRQIDGILTFSLSGNSVNSATGTCKVFLGR